MMLRLVGIVLLATTAAFAEPLPDPLSLDQALAQSQAHPLQDLARAEVLRAQAKLDEVRSRNGLQLSASASLAYIEPSRYSLFQSHEDNSAGISLSKTLYDFGYTQAGESAAGKKLEGRMFLEKEVRQNRRIEVMEAFFNVLLADLEYTRDNEALAIAFIRMDKGRDRHELKQVSDIELLEMESAYETVLQKRTASGARQVSARYRLAAAMNRPNDLPHELVMPEMAKPEMLKLEFSELLAEIKQNNPQIQWLRLALESARDTASEAGRRYGPRLKAEVRANAYERETGSTDPFRAALTLEVPLYTGGRQDAETAMALADVAEKEALLAQSELQTTQKAAELWVELEGLQASYQEMEKHERFRDLYLDRSRSLYEMEVVSDLGDAMVQTSDVALKKTKAGLQWLLVMAKLDALRGALSGAE